MNKKNFLFIIKSTAIYAFAYLIIGGIAYQLITKQFYIGGDPIFAGFLRNEANPAEWAHTTIWLVPALLLRGALISIVLLPFVEALSEMAFAKRVAVLFSLMFVLIHLAAAAPSPSNIEGLVYMKPQFIGIGPFLLTQPEMLFQCLIFAAGLSWVIKKPSE
jgi:hypothetical protein